ncbi:MAG: hypothetical protein ACYCVL_05410 [Gemmatimonadaceae bacterium]
MIGRALSMVVLATSLAAAQKPAPRAIDPGMNLAQVTQRLGRPAVTRTAGDYTYLFYPNSCGRRCGMNDLVVLKKDAVVDAIFRSPERRYTGTSSSPVAIPPDRANAMDPVHKTPPARGGRGLLDHSSHAK